jgi:GxxExxY protein
MNLEPRKPGNRLADAELTSRILAAAIAVHRELGPGFLEAIYEEALAIEFTATAIPFERQKPIALTYRDQHIGEHRLDFLVGQKVVVELKAISAFEDIHFATVRSYLKACQLESGLLLNFAAPILAIKRVGREFHSRNHSPDFLS